MTARPDLQVNRPMDFERALSKRLVDGTQAAVDATAAAWADDCGIDVARYFREQIDSRGLSLEDTAWVVEVTTLIGSGQPVTVGEPDAFPC